MPHWLLKTEPGAYSIADLERDGTTRWDGVRNAQARNYLRDLVGVGDGVLIYHSGVRPPGVVGRGEVVRAGYEDPTDTDAAPGTSPWVAIDVAWCETFPAMVTLDQIRAHPDLADMMVLRRPRLSVQPLEARHFDLVVELARSG